MTSFFLAQSYYIGIEMCGSSLRAAKLCKKGGRWNVVSLNEISSTEHSSLLKKQLNGGLVISPLNSRDLLVRPCEIPLKKTKDLLAALDFHIEPLLPYPTEKGVVQIEINEKLENGTAISLFAIRKDHLTHHLERLQVWNLEPEVITTKGHALAAFSTLLPQTLSPRLLVHEGDGELTFVLLEKEKILALRAIETKKDLKSEIQKILLNLASTHKGKSFDTLYFLGKDLEIKALLESVSGKTISPLTSPLLGQNSDDLMTYGLAIGSAIAKSRVDFRQREFVYPHRFKKLQKPLVAFFTLAALLAGSVYFSGEALINRKKHSLEEAYLSLVKAEGVASGDFRPKTVTEYMTALNTLEEEIRSRPDTFPLLPQIPKVKDILGWIASLRESQGIALELFNYQFVKCPDFSHKQEKYKIRVEIEISAHSPNDAKLFQETLKGSNPLIDANEEITWAPLKGGKYRATFYLKDKTRYHG